MTTSSVAEQLSIPLAIPVFAGDVSASHSIVKLAGQVITGGVESSTIIVWIQFVELLLRSEAVQVRVIVYSYCPHPAVP